MRHFARGALLAAPMILSAVLATAADLRFGISTEYNPEEMAKRWQPLLDAVGERAGVKILLDMPRDIPSYYAKYEKGGYDLALINQRIFVKTKKGLYSVIARPDARLQGILVVAKDSPYQSIKELKGRKIAFPSPESYAATLLNLEELKEAGAEPPKTLTVQYLGSHEKVFDAVRSGAADAGGGVMRIFMQLDRKISDKLRLLHSSKPAISHPFVINAAVKADVAKRVQEALIDLGKTPQGAALLKSVGMAQLIAAKDSEYEAIRGKN